ncbi:hypothetical protein GCM10007938_24920 [Vibrio zhanjiangensis]|uniref:Bacteriophage N4 adsorption protein A C-terminal domain-containing protein n=1 Tax=Vibrio zhanjiangensis TaxID=1046128 RepID=A0ABQ6F0C7_9VIBR|nr:tetratricopeptide repeat protein [Vibrio zhanjiangensis]GLT18711.1 hypothetical protein GCM10007938_24920 [Vibrio zhanjiangensis]
MRVIRYIKISIIVISLLTAPSLDAVRDGTIDLASYLSDSAHFRTFPYLNRAFAYERSQRITEAIVEVERALNIAPNYLPFLRYLFKLQLKAKLFAKAEATLQRLPIRERSKLLAAVRSEMSVQQLTLTNCEFLALLDGLSIGAKRQVYLYRLYWLADTSESIALEWSVSQPLSIKPDQAIVYEAEAWLKRENYTRVLNTMAQLKDRKTLSDREQYLVGLALLKSDQVDDAVSILIQSESGETKLLLARQLIANLTYDHQYDRALSWFKWLEQHYVLSSKDYANAYNLALNIGDWELARAYQKHLYESSCTENALISARLGNSELAKQQLSSCSSFESPKLWLSLAEELNLSFLIESASFNDSKLTHRQKLVVAWNKYNQGEYQKTIDILLSTSLSINSRRLLASAYDKNGEFKDSMREWKIIYRQYNQLSDLLNLLEVMKRALTEVELIREYEQLLSDVSLSSKIRRDIAEQLLFLYSKHPESFNPEIAMRLTDIDIRSFTRASLWQFHDTCAIAQTAFTKPQTTFGWQVLGYCSYEASPQKAIEYTDNALLLEKSPSSHIEILGIKAQMLFKQQRYNEVLEILLPSWKKQSPHVRLLISKAYLQLGQHEMANDWWRVTDEKEILEWWLLGSDIYLSEKNFSAAQDMLKKAENKFGSNLEFVARHVTLYKLLESNNELTDYLSRQHDSYPDDIYITTELAYAYFVTEPELSVRLFESVIPRLEGRDKITARHQLAQGYKKIGLRKQAQSEYQVLIDQLTTMPIQDTQLIDQLKSENRDVNSNWKWALSGESGGSSPFQNLLQDSSNNTFYQLSASYRLDDHPSLSGQLNLLSSGTWDTMGIDLGITWKPLQRYDLSLSSGVREYWGDDSFMTTYLRLNGDVFSGLGWNKAWKGLRQSSWSNSLYLDAFYQFYDNRTLLYARGESGPVWGLVETHHQRIRTYGLLQASDDTQAEPSLKIGAGIGWLASFNDDKYKGYGNETEISVEWQKQLNDNEQDELVLRFSAYY